MRTSRPPDPYNYVKKRTPGLEDPYDYNGFRRLRASAHVTYAQLASKTPMMIAQCLYRVVSLPQLRLCASVPPPPAAELASAGIAER